jgi:hypothetical protein
MTLEELYLGIPDIDIDYFIFANTESLSAPIGDRFVIAIDPTKVRSEADEKVKVAHEAGHCRTNSFYSPGEDYFLRQRYENRADKWAIKKLVPKDELESAVAAGITEPWELAEHFGVPEPFFRKVMAFYAP